MNALTRSPETTDCVVASDSCWLRTASWKSAF